MIRYYLHGLEVTRGAAIRVWRKSRTYRRAAFKDQIWPKAEAEIERGALSEDVRIHLREAGLSMGLCHDDNDVINARGRP